MSSVAIRPWMSSRLSSRRDRRGAHPEPRARAGRACQEVHPGDRDQAEQDAPQAPSPRSVAEQLDPTGDDQFCELGMLGVRILVQRCVVVGGAGGRMDPVDHPRRVDVVRLVEDQRVIAAVPARRGARATEVEQRAPRTTIPGSARGRPPAPGVGESRLTTLPTAANIRLTSLPTCRTWGPYYATRTTKPGRRPGAADPRSGAATSVWRPPRDLAAYSARSERCISVARSSLPVPDRHPGRERAAKRRVAKPAERSHRPIERHVGEQHDELVAAEPGDDVACPERRLHPVRGLPQRAVSVVVSVLVVQGLELIEVDRHQRDRRRPGAARAGTRRWPSPASRDD